MVEYDTKLSHIRPLNQIYALYQSKAIEQPIGCSIACMMFIKSYGILSKIILE
jgi:hypothetical protein